MTGYRNWDGTDSNEVRLNSHWGQFTLKIVRRCIAFHPQQHRTYSLAAISVTQFLNSNRKIKYKRPNQYSLIKSHLYFANLYLEYLWTKFVIFSQFYFQFYDIEHPNICTQMYVHIKSASTESHRSHHVAAQHSRIHLINSNNLHGGERTKILFNLIEKQQILVEIIHFNSSFNWIEVF